MRASSSLGATTSRPPVPGASPRLAADTLPAGTIAQPPGGPKVSAQKSSTVKFMEGALDVRFHPPPLLGRGVPGATPVKVPRPGVFTSAGS